MEIYGHSVVTLLWTSNTSVCVCVVFSVVFELSTESKSFKETRVLPVIR